MCDSHIAKSKRLHMYKATVFYSFFSHKRTNQGDTTDSKAFHEEGCGWLYQLQIGKSKKLVNKMSNTWLIGALSRENSVKAIKALCGWSSFST